MLGGGQWNRYRSLRVPAKPDLDADAVTLADGVLRLLEVDRHLGIVVIEDGDGRLLGSGGHDRRRQRSECQPERLVVIVDRVIGRRERE